MELRLESPFGAEAILLSWPLPSSFDEETDDSDEIIKTIRLVRKEFPEYRVPFGDDILNLYNPHSYESMKSLCDHFNRVVKEMLLINGNIERVQTNASRRLAEHILVQVYNQTVKEPDRLNQYEPFSPEVYGETSFELICQMIDHISITADDVFIDLGSGVGQVVLQMAALTSCKTCFGIEKADVPAHYAEALSKNFQKWMAWFGKKYGDYKLVKGDFLDEQFRERITSASLIFVNNFAFGPSVDHNLKGLFADLNDGARIVSSKSFCPINFRITDRNLSDIGTIMHVSEMQPMYESVSWTGKPVSYFLHVIDRTKLERYFQKLKQPPQPKRSVKRARSVSSTSSREGSVESIASVQSRKRTNGGNRKSRSRQCNNNRRRNSSNKTSRNSSVGSENPTRSQSRKSSENEEIQPKTSPWNNPFEEFEDNVPRVTTRRGWNQYIRQLEQSKKPSKDDKKTHSSQPPSKKPSSSTKPEKTQNKPSLKNTEVRSIPQRASPKLNGENSKFKELPVLEAVVKSEPETIVKLEPETVVKLEPGLPSVSPELTDTSEETFLLIGKDDNDRRPVPSELIHLLRTFKTQYLDMMEQMKEYEFKKSVVDGINKEKQKNVTLSRKKKCLESLNNKLVTSGTDALKKRMGEVGINLETSFLEQAQQVVEKHQRLQKEATVLQQMIKSLEKQQEDLSRRRFKELIALGLYKEFSNPEEKPELFTREVVRVLT